jgi:hypothetical protein
MYTQSKFVSLTFHFHATNACAPQDRHQEICTTIAYSICNILSRPDDRHWWATVALKILCALEHRVCVVTDALVESVHQL